MKKLLNNYLKTFDGLSREIWWLSLITLINRTGAVVALFLSLYLTQVLGFSKSEVGWVMTFYGLGSVSGTWLGGKLTDKFGYYKIMVTSLFLTAIGFFLLQFVTSFVGFCIGMFCLLMFADMFRPANFVAISAYSKPENKTRSVTLVRLAINLGFTAGSTSAGLIIAFLSYKGLFWMDALTCLCAAILMLVLLNPKKARVLDKVEVVKNPISPYADKPFWFFFFSMMLFGFVFLQYFSTIPLFYKEVHHLSEFQIGLLMALSGVIIFVFEMPMIKWLEGKKYTKIDLMIFGGLLLATSILILNFSLWVGILVVGILLMTIGEMVAFPFSNAFALERSKRGNQGAYMGMYSLSFSIAHIFGHNTGMQLVENIGFNNTWYIIFGITMLSGFFMWLLRRSLNKGR